jgi:hypothetical protein
MQTITLEIDNSEDAEMILLLAKRMKWKIQMDSSKKETSNSAKALAILKEIADRGNMIKIIPDPVAWQREIRKDRPLLGREE